MNQAPQPPEASDHVNESGRTITSTPVEGSGQATPAKQPRSTGWYQGLSGGAHRNTANGASPSTKRVVGAIVLVIVELALLGLLLRVSAGEEPLSRPSPLWMQGFACVVPVFVGLTLLTIYYPRWTSLLDRPRSRGSQRKRTLVGALMAFAIVVWIIFSPDARQRFTPFWLRGPSPAPPIRPASWVRGEGEPFGLEYEAGRGWRPGPGWGTSSSGAAERVGRRATAPGSPVPGIRHAVQIADPVPLSPASAHPAHLRMDGPRPMPIELPE